MTTDFQRGAELLFRNSQLDTKIDKLNEEYLEELYRHKGEKCMECGVIQGKSKHGFREFFCDHLDNRIIRQQREKEKEIQKEFTLFLQQSIT